MIKISVTNIEFYTKNYLMFTNNFRKKVRNVRLFIGKFFKNGKKVYCSTFVTVTVIL